MFIIFHYYFIIIGLYKYIDYPGFTIGVPIRELNGPNTLTNNLPFGLLISTNIFLDKFGLSLGGFPPPSAATEHDN